MSTASFRERLLVAICQYDYILYLAFIFEIVLLLFATLSFFFADLDRETELILLIDFVLLGAVTTVTVAILYTCNKYT